MNRPELEGVLETALYVDDLERSVAFYKQLFVFELLFRSDRAVGFNVEGRQVLLLFRKGVMSEPIVSERGVIPPHDGEGNLHVAFSIPQGALAAWEERLSSLGIEVEARYQWELGGNSVYFRDPDGHLLELVTPGCWTIY